MKNSTQSFIIFINSEQFISDINGNESIREDIENENEKEFENINNNNIIESNNFNNSKTNKNSQIKESITNPKLLLTFGEGGNMISGESLRIKSKNATIKANAFEGNNTQKFTETKKYEDEGEDAEEKDENDNYNNYNNNNTFNFNDIYKNINNFDSNNNSKNNYSKRENQFRF